MAATQILTILEHPCFPDFDQFSAQILANVDSRQDQQGSNIPDKSEHLARLKFAHELKEYGLFELV